MIYWTIFLCIVMSLLGIYYYFRHFNYFKRNGILHISPALIFGLVWFIFRRISFVDYLHKVYYFKPNAKYCGFYFINRPIILLRDPELIKEVFVKNFKTFPNRRGFGEFNENLLTNNLFSLRNEKWRDVRTLLSPAFTPIKMKTMCSMISNYAADFVKRLSEISADTSEMEMKQVFSKYMSDVIIKCAFGIEVDSMSDLTNKFYLFGKEASSSIGTRDIKFLFFRMFPALCKFLRLKFLSGSAPNFFEHIIKTTIATRDAENITCPDMIQLMMDMRGKRANERELSIDDMVAQAFVLFFGSFDSSTNAMSFIAHQIAVNPDVQMKLRQEIDEVLKNSNGEVTYEAVNQLKYLDAVINETLRLYPPVVFVERICENTYEFPPALPSEKSVTLKKGQIIWIPIYTIHHDKKYYDEPEKFYPERFLDTKEYYNSSYYLPFGLGPRMCIAKRFALLEIKILIFHLLARCELKPCAKTPLSVKLSKNCLDPMLEGGYWLNIQRRNDMQPNILSNKDM